MKEQNSYIVYLGTSLSKNPFKVLVLEKTEKTYLLKNLDDPNKTSFRITIEDFHNKYFIIEELGMYIPEDLKQKIEEAK